MNEFQELLKLVDRGKKNFAPESNNKDDMEVFQHLAKMLEHAKSCELLDGLVTHRESYTGNRWYDRAFLTGGLSYKGELLARSEPENKEILRLKPEFQGISIDIKEAIRRLLQNWKSGETK